MVKTYGLTHVAVAVADLDRASDFYKNVFGSVVVYRSAEMVQLQTPGSRDVLVFEKRPEAAGTRSPCQNASLRRRCDFCGSGRGGREVTE